MPTPSQKYKEEKFYKETTKREMFLIIKQWAELLKSDNVHWTEKAKEEREIIHQNGIE